MQYVSSHAVFNFTPELPSLTQIAGAARLKRLHVEGVIRISACLSLWSHLRKDIDTWNEPQLEFTPIY